MDESDDSQYDIFKKELDEIKRLSVQSKLDTITNDDPKDGLQSLYLNEYLSDISFKIGTNGEHIPAHRMVFYLSKCAKINDQSDSHNEITLKQTDSRSFKLFLAYIYSLEIDLTEDDVPNVLKLCDLFECEKLRQMCIDFKLKCFEEEMRNKIKHMLTFAKSTITRNENISYKRAFVNNFQPLEDSITTNDLNQSNKKIRLNNSTANITISDNNSDSTQLNDVTVISNEASDANLSKNYGDVSIDYCIIAQICCHSRNARNVTVWRSLFTPIQEHESKSIVTCGGYTSAFIEILSNDQWKVIKTIDKIETETLFSVSCTVLSSDDNTSLISGKHVVLALGGENCIYLAYNHKVYRKLNAHTQSVYSLLFHSNKPLWLFSASCDQTIKIWDIGSIFDEKPKFNDTQLLTTISTKFPIISMSYSFKYDTLIASGESSDVMFLKNITTLKPLEAKTRIGDGITSISGLSFACDSKYIALKPSKSGQILITKFSPINEIIVSRNKNKRNSPTLEINFVSFASLKYSTPSEDRAFIYLCERSAMIACGDDCGRVYLYDIRAIKCGDLLEPIKILELPIDDRAGDTGPPIVISVDISHDLKHITASTNNNLVCIWKQTERK